jgi:hypothetical protein
MKRTLMLLVALGALAVTLSPSLSMAQPPNGPRRERARTFLVLRIVEALNLNEQDALKVSSTIRQSDERRQQLIQQRQALEERLRAALAKKPADAADLAKLVGEGNDLDQKIALVPEESFRELQKVLTVEQQAKLLLFRRELQGEIRRAWQGRRGSGGRRWLRGGAEAGESPPGDD